MPTVQAAPVIEVADSGHDSGHAKVANSGHVELANSAHTEVADNGHAEVADGGHADGMPLVTGTTLCLPLHLSLVLCSPDTNLTDVCSSTLPLGQ